MTSDNALLTEAPVPVGEEAPAIEDDSTAPTLPAPALPPLDKPPLDPRVLSTVISSYEGDTVVVPQCDSPVYHGVGTVVFRTGFTYSGTFHFGRMHGRGRIEWTSRVTYDGDFVDNEMIGHGTYSWPNGSSYVGDILRGRRHGHGVFCTGTRGTVALPPSGLDAERASSMFPLQFAFHSDNASDAIDATSNARYEGQWIDGLPHGRGVLVFDDDQNVRYEGDFVEGKRHGRGEMRYASGNVYVGEWERDVKSGHGTMLWMAAGGGGPIEKYDGAWRDDRPHGNGRHVWLGAARQHQREKNWYEGAFANGVRHGLGVFFYANGARYEGEWVDNVKHGAGVFFYEDGRVFVGDFRDDRAVETEPSEPVGGKIVLFVDDLLLLDGRDKARKLVEHAVLRLNTELRALYRQYIALPAPGSPTRPAPSPVRVGDDAPEASAVLMEYYECRRLLGDCGLKLSAGHLERHLQCLRDAQRAATVPDDGKRPTVHVTDAVTLAASLPEVVPPSRLLLFREFVELLVRLAHERQERESERRNLPVQGLADAFIALHEELSYERQQRASRGIKLTTETDGWSSVLEQLHAKELHAVYLKHHRAFQQLFVACSRRHQRKTDAAEPVDDEVEVETVAVRALVAQLQELHTFTPSFRVRDGVLALQQAFSLDDDSATSDTSVDPFFLETPLLFTDFVDAISIVLLTKQRQVDADPQQEQAPVGTPLFALVDEFLHTLPTTV